MEFPAGRILHEVCDLESEYATILDRRRTLPLEILLRGSCSALILKVHKKPRRKATDTLRSDQTRPCPAIPTKGEPECNAVQIAYMARGDRETSLLSALGGHLS
jgi:hypothetical protein